MKWTVSDLIRAERITEPSSEMVCTPRGEYVYWSDFECKKFIEEMGNPVFVWECDHQLSERN